MVEGGETARFIVQTMNVLIRSVRFQLQIVKNDLLIAQQIDQREEQFLILGRLHIVRLQRNHHIGARLSRMGAIGLVRRHLMYWATPLTADACVLAVGRTIFTLGRFVVIDRFVRKLLRAVLTFGRQLRNCLLDRQIARRVVLTDLCTAVRTGGILIAQSSVSQQMREASSAHQMSHGALR